ncbi:MAG: molybdenum cofactor guanylyltransferase MobA [Nitrosomonadaceae bacterium]|nr:molybdenum cofactor guanylyltransferase MobA [Nitrosomonadaceae bacterium]
MIAREHITGLVLAGGRGSRMGEVDKGLQVFRGKPMVAHVIERFAPQVGGLLINANRNQETYASYGYDVVVDDIPGFAGPLAGLHIGMHRATTPYIVTAPCDSPFLPLDLVARLTSSLEAEGADLAVAKSEGFAQPVFSLTRTNLEPHLRAFLASGQRKIDKWYASLKVVEVEFADAQAFANINTLEELQALEPRTGAAS